MNFEMPVQIMWGIVGYVLITTAGSIWWAATTTQQLKTLKESLKELSTMNSLYARREDIIREFGIYERDLQTLFVKFDKLKEKVDGGIK